MKFIKQFTDGNDTNKYISFVGFSLGLIIVGSFLTFMLEIPIAGIMVGLGFYCLVSQLLK